MVKSSVSSGKRNLRLALSGLIICISMLGSWWIIESSKITETYLVTIEDLASGSAISASNLATADLALFGLGENYLTPSQLPPGAYLNRSAVAGEVIPLSAITTNQLADWSYLVVTPSVELSNQIRPGSRVMVWASPALEYRSYGEPSIAAVDVEVVEIREPTNGFGQSGKSVELRVPFEALQVLLRAISNGDSIALTASGYTLAD